MAYATNAIFNTVKGAMIVCQSASGTTQLVDPGVVGSVLSRIQVLLIPTQIEESGVVNGMRKSGHASIGTAQSQEPVTVDDGMTGSQAPQDPAQSLEPCALEGVR